MIQLYEKDVKFSLNKKPKVVNRNTKNKWGLVAVTVSWCHYCQNMKPEFKASANMLEGNQLFFATIDADKSPKLVEKLGVSSFPTIFFIDKDGSIKDKYQGERDKFSFNHYMCVMTRQCRI